MCRLGIGVGVVTTAYKGHDVIDVEGGGIYIPATDAAYAISALKYG